MYRIIETSFWDDPKIKPHGPNVKLLAVYLFGNDQAHLSGLYFFSKGLASEKTGIPSKAIEEAFQVLCREGFCFWDERLGVVWVKNLLRKHGRGAKVAQAVASHLKTLHKTPLIKTFLEYYREYNIPYQLPADTLSDTLCHTPSDGVSDTQTVQNQYQYQSTVLSPLTSPPSQPAVVGGAARAIRDPERLTKELSKIDLAKFRAKYPDIDVDKVFERFCNRVVGACNPQRYTNLERAFHNWCLKEQENHPKTVPKKSSIDIIRERRQRETKGEAI